MSPAEKKRLAYLEAMGIQVWTARFQGSALADRVAPEFGERDARPMSEGEEVAIDRPDATAGENLISPAVLSGGGSGAQAMPDFPSPPPVPVRAGDFEPGTPPSARPVGAVPAPRSGDARQRDIANSEGPQFADSVSGALWPETVDAEAVAASAGLCDWDTLERRVAACTACPLHQSRTQTVFGVGDRDADWMVIGEAPGEQEDLRGEPFVGPAGLLLSEMLRAIGLGREKVFIANILKCRPPKNRDPQPQEAEACEGYLKQQVALVKPRIILAVGRVAGQNLLKTATPIGKLRGLVHRYENIPLVVTYHPAYLLRSPTEKRRAWEDLRLALKTYRQSQ